MSEEGVIFIFADESGKFSLVTEYSKDTFKYMNCFNHQADICEATWNVDEKERKRGSRVRFEDDTGKPVTLKLDESKKLDQKSIDTIRNNDKLKYYYYEKNQTVSQSLPSKLSNVVTSIGFSSDSVHINFRSTSNDDKIPNSETIQINENLHAPEMPRHRHHGIIKAQPGHVCIQ